jgi:peptidoglycan hydrolase-like protein with peptidoglycan-binding domain
MREEEVQPFAVVQDQEPGELADHPRFQGSREQGHEDLEQWAPPLQGVQQNPRIRKRQNDQRQVSPEPVATRTKKIGRGMSGRDEIRAGVDEGSDRDEVRSVHEYLERFGYLGTKDPEHDVYGAPYFPMAEGDEAGSLEGRPSPTQTGSYDEATADAVRHFQEFARLPVTGVVDDATEAKMNQPRCGHADPAGLAEFTTTRRKWATNNLRYAFQNFTPDVSDNDVTRAIEQAFALWAVYAPLRPAPHRFHIGSDARTGEKQTYPKAASHARVSRLDRTLW